MSNNRYDFSLLQSSSVSQTATLLYISQSKYDEDWNSVQHTHRCSELFYVMEGEGQFLIENKIYPVSANDLIIVNPNVLHTEISFRASPLKYIVLGVEGLELSLKGENDEDKNFYIVNFKNLRELILFYLKAMLSEIESKAPGCETICQNLMEVLVILLERQTDFSATLAPVNKKATRLCSSIRRFLDNHYMENVTLDQLAEMSHVSKYHLAHAFSAEYGVSPINYLISCRIHAAEYLLKTTDYSLALISRSCGFSSPSYFAQIFKKQKGCSPSEFRRQEQ
jgi:AraC-like DNA-binding protein/mannose-6-phosphate isomerase-like protein (cupin superfamily)